MPELDQNIKGEIEGLIQNAMDSFNPEILTEVYKF